MTQRDRDWLVVLKKAQNKLITQKQAAREQQLTERQVRRLVKRLEACHDAVRFDGQGLRCQCCSGAFVQPGMRADRETTSTP